MQHDDDIAVGGPILFLIAVIFGIGVYNEIDEYFTAPPQASAVQTATDYAERAEDELRAAQEANEAEEPTR